MLYMELRIFYIIYFLVIQILSQIECNGDYYIGPSMVLTFMAK